MTPLLVLAGLLQAGAVVWVLRARALGWRILAALALALVALLSPEWAGAACNVIPLVPDAFRGALGTVDRPYAFPSGLGRKITLTLGECDHASPGLIDLDGGATPVEDDYFVTFIFTPPGDGPVNVVVLTTLANQSTCEALVLAADALPGGGSARCQLVQGDTKEFDILNPSTVHFRLPDTDVDLAPNGDLVSLTGPLKIAVTSASNPSLPLGLASSRCADAGATEEIMVACIDELFSRDGTCETAPDHVDPVFGHFTALPHVNDFQELCEASGTPCGSGAQGSCANLRFTVDSDGNALLPLNWMQVLPRVTPPTPRIVYGDLLISELGDALGPVAIPSASSLGSYSPEGRRLLTVFNVVSDSTDNLSFFGTIDARLTVLRFARRSPDLTTGVPIYRQCTAGDNAGLSCVLDTEVPDRDCPGGTCSQATCHDTTGIDRGVACSVDEDCAGFECGPMLFDFRDRLFEGAGPILIPPEAFAFSAGGVVPLDGQVVTSDLFLVVEQEEFAATESCGATEVGGDLNGDGDTTDPVIVVRDRKSGRVLTMSDETGRSTVEIRQPPFAFSAVAAEGSIVAFLEPEPLQGDCSAAMNCDKNGDGDMFDTILRVYHRSDDCGDGNPCLTELTAALVRPLAIDPNPFINGSAIAVSEGYVFYRVSEAAAAKQSTVRVSVFDGGSICPAIGFCLSAGTAPSADARFVAFDVFGSGVYVFDRLAETPIGQTVLVSVGAAGDPEPGSGAADISDDGRIVAFQSPAKNLVDNDANGFRDVFVLDTQDPNTTRIVSVHSDGTQGNNHSGDGGSVMLSGDGNFVVFPSLASNLVDDDDEFDNVSDVFVHDLTRRTTERVSIGTDGAPGNEPSAASQEAVGISRDGRFVAFHSLASNFDDRVNSPTDHIYVRDRVLGTTELVSVAFDGIPGDNSSFEPAISANGRYVSFISFARNLVTSPPSGMALNAYLYDRDTGLTERTSVRSDGGVEGNANDFTRITAVSGDGRFVVFLSTAALVDDDTNNLDDVYVYDRLTGLISRATLDSEGAQAETQTFPVVSPVISDNGNFPAYAVGAPDLVANGVPGILDAFVRGPDARDPFNIDARLFPDGELDDTVLQILNTNVEPPIQITLLPATLVAVAGDSAAFLRPESADEDDRNSDGDVDDGFVFLSEQGGPPQDLGQEAIEVALTDRLVVALVPLAAQVGEVAASTVAIYDRQAPGEGWTQLEPAAVQARAAAELVAFIADATGQLYLFDKNTEATTPVGLSAEDLVLSDKILAFRTSGDHVMHVLDVESGRLFNTGQVATPCPQEACDPRTPYRILGSSVVFVTDEAEQGDLIADGVLKRVLQTFNVEEALLTLEPQDQGRARRGTSPTSEEAADCVSVVAALDSGVCTNSGQACSLDSDCCESVVECTATCFLPPGRCSEPTNASCTCNTATGCSVGCPSAGQFCVLPSGRLVGTCHIDLNMSCSEDAECGGGDAVCTDALRDVVRIIDPVAGRGGGERRLYSAAVAVSTTGASCKSDDDCQESEGEECNDAGACEVPRLQLVIISDPDTDGDGETDSFDNCPRQPNAGQLDSDGDQAGDVCDRDNDNDGVLDGVDNCSLAANAAQIDVDGDGYGNACDCDFNQDGICDGFDEFIYLLCVNGIFPAADPNCAESDMNADGVVDAADQDLLFDGQPTMPVRPPGPTSCIHSDADMWCDFADNCPFISNPDQANSDDLPPGDACQCGDVDADGDVDILDVVLASRHAANASTPPFFELSRCSVVGGPSDCDMAVVESLRNYLAGAPTVLDQVCAAAF